MADVTGDGSGLTKSVHTSDEAHRRLRRRYNFEWRFKAIGMAAIALAAFALIALLSTVLGNAVGAMRETYITIPVQLDMEVIGVLLTPIETRSAVEISMALSGSH